MRADTMLKEYETMKKRLSVAEFQLSQFEGVSESDVIHSMTLAHPQEGERVQTSNISDKTASVALNYRQVMERENREWFNYLLKEYRYISEELSFFESCVKSLPDNLPSLVMDLINKENTWDEIATKYSIARSTITKYRKRAIMMIDEMYELRDKQTEAYILS